MPWSDKFRSTLVRVANQRAPALAHIAQDDVDVWLALHEAGHTVAELAQLNTLPEMVTIKRAGKAFGSAIGQPSARVKEAIINGAQLRLAEVDRDILVLMGGVAAEALGIGKVRWANAESDYATALFLLESVEDISDADCCFEAQAARIVDVVAENWESVQSVALALLERRTLNRRMLASILHVE